MHASPSTLAIFQIPPSRLPLHSSIPSLSSRPSGSCFPSQYRPSSLHQYHSLASHSFVPLRVAFPCFIFSPIPMVYPLLLLLSATVWDPQLTITPTIFPSLLPLLRHSSLACSLCTSHFSIPLPPSCCLYIHLLPPSLENICV